MRLKLLSVALQREDKRAVAGLKELKNYGIILSSHCTLEIIAAFEWKHM